MMKMTSFGLLLLSFTATVLAQDKAKVSQASLKVKKLPLEICGESSESAFEKKIFDGSPAELGAYPWMAAIGYTSGDQGPYWNCGGTLITDQYVITAAHCIVPDRINTYKPFLVSVVRLGDLDLDYSVSDGAAPVDIPVDDITYHERYNHVAKLNDIGLLRLKWKVQFDKFIRPVCLPPPEFRSNSFVSKMAVVAGWGKTTFDEEAPQTTHLMEAEVEVKDLKDCKKNITSVLPRAVLDKTVLCAGSPGKDSCQGDSGGPLMLFRRYKGRARMFLLGVVSYGYSCAEEGYPGVYTKVSEHMPWIIDNLDVKYL